MKDKNTFASKALEVMCRLAVVVGVLGVAGGCGGFYGGDEFVAAAVLLSGSVLVSGGLIALVLYWKD